MFAVPSGLEQGEQRNEYEKAVHMEQMDAVAPVEDWDNNMNDPNPR